MSRPVRVLLVVVLVLAVVAAGTLLLPRLVQRGGDVGSPGPTSATPTIRPADEVDAPGYDPSPGPFSTTPVAEATGEPISVSFALEEGATHSGGTVGLSLEATDLASPVWGSEDSNIDEMLDALDRPILRFGGNSVDRRMWWTSSDEAPPEWATATVTPADLERVARVAEKADAQVTIVVDLGHDDPDRAADMATHAREAFGDHLAAISVGNEPNGYDLASQPQLQIRGDGWGPQAYQTSLRTYADAIEARSPGTPIAGPGTFDATWWRAFASADLPHTAALSMHWYPLWDCNGPASSIANPTVEDLTSPSLRTQAHKILGMGEAEASKNNLPLWLEETGPTSCPGTNAISRTHAQALWTVDYVLTAEEIGAERIAFHSTLQACKGGAPMSPICATGTKDEPGELFQGRTSYLALMQLGWLQPGRVLTPTVSGDGRIMVHGVLGDDGSLGLVIVDMRDPATDADSPVTVSMPSGLDENAPQRWVPAEGSRLTGDALDAQANALRAPAPVNGELTEGELARGAPLKVTSAPGSVTMLRLTPAEDADRPKR